MNKENKFEHLTLWCEDYYEKSGLKVHPSSVPLDVVLDELMGKFNQFATWVMDLAKSFNVHSQQLLQLQQDLLDCKEQILELENPIEEIKPENKKVKK